MKNINIDNIKVSSRLDNVINSAITEGYEKKKNRRCKNNIAVAVIAIIMGTVIIKPDFVSAAISKFKNTIESFSSNENSYLIPEEYKTAIGKTIEDKNIKVTLNEFYIDKNLIVFTTTLDSRERSDYAQGMNTEIYIDGQLLEYTSSTGGYIHNDDGTVDILTTIYDEGLVINPNSNIVIKFNDIEVTNIFDFDKKITGNWQYNFTISSEDFTDKIITKTLNETLAVNDINISINEITISPNIIRLNTELNNDVRFVIKDDKGNEYEPSSGFGVRENTIDYIYQINAKEVISLTLIPKVNYNDNETSVLEYDKSIKLDIK